MGTYDYDALIAAKAAELTADPEMQATIVRDIENDLFVMVDASAARFQRMLAATLSDTGTITALGTFAGGSYTISDGLVPVDPPADWPPLPGS